MGSLLSQPNKSLGLLHGTQKEISFALAEIQGYRPTMEDDTLIIPSFPAHPNFSLFGVFDGHRTELVSKYLAENLGARINSLPTLDGDSIKSLLLNMDEDFCKNMPKIAIAGSTVILVLIERLPKALPSSSPTPLNSESPEDSPASSPAYKATVFNIGDSRCWLFNARTGAFTKLSSDHKADLPEEKKRILNAGGSVVPSMGVHRVDGDLAMSRAFGDRELKQNPNLPHDEQKVIAVADVKEAAVEEGDLLFLSCDGIFENVRWNQVLDYLQKYKEEAESLRNRIIELNQNGASSEGKSLGEGQGNEQEGGQGAFVNLNWSHPALDASSEAGSKSASAEEMGGNEFEKSSRSLELSRERETLLSNICKDLINFALEHKSNDNMTSMTLHFGRTEDTSIERSFSADNIDVFLKGNPSSISSYIAHANKFGLSTRDALFEGLKNEYKSLVRELGGSGNMGAQGKEALEKKLESWKNSLENVRNVLVDLGKNDIEEIIMRLRDSG